MFEKILLAVDGSEHSLHAARTAANLARAISSTEIRIVVVFDSVPPYLGEPNLQQAIECSHGKRKSGHGKSNRSSGRSFL